MRVCTIIAKNYLAHARVLADSFLEHNPGGSVSVLVIDDFEGYIDPAEESFEVLTPGDIGVDDFDLMAGIYDVLELSTAVKPWLLAHLLAREERVVYLDPDIEVFDALDELDRLIAEHGLVLTPHNTEPLPDDGKRPSQTDILVSGAYNLGFIGLRSGDDADGLLEWWSDRLRRECRSDVEQGLFVDQRWVDLVPGMVSEHLLLRDPGYNVAYWNLPSRQLTTADGGFRVNGMPLRFFHYSGYDPDRPRQLSRHQNRVRLAEEPYVRELCDVYRAKLREAGYKEISRWPYELDRLGNGAFLDPERRTAYRKALEQGGVGGSIFTPGGASELEQWHRSQVEGSGVNVIGYLRGEFGNGESAREAAAALRAARIPLRQVVISSPHHREQAEFDGAEGPPDMPRNLVCVNADTLRNLAAEPDFRRLLKAHYTIGLWWWEVGSFPASMAPAFGLVDEVWAGSAFIAEALRPSATVPVHQVAVPVAPGDAPQIDRDRLGFPGGHVFLFVWDYHGIAERKNPLGLVEAYRTAFPEPTEASLVLKCVNSSRYRDYHSRLKAAVADRPDIKLIEDYVSIEEKNAMIAACDTYVSLHRSEGFGITLAEAMYYGRPVIATGFSGNLDFMTPQNSFLVEHRLVPVGEGVDPYPPEAEWAEPDLEDAARLMREAVENPEEARRRGERAAADIRRSYSRETAGETMAERLSDLEGASRSSRLLEMDDQPATVAARRVRNRVLLGPPKKARMRFSAPLRNLLLRLMKPWTYHQRQVDLQLLDAIDQINVALHELEEVRSSAEGWRSVSEEGAGELISFDHPVAGRVSGYRVEQGHPPGRRSSGGRPPLERRRRPYRELLAGREPAVELEAGLGTEALFARLDELEPGSQAAVVGYDVAEVLPYEELRRFLELARTRLRSEGLLILESANPHSTEVLKEALADPRRAVPLLPEVLLASCRDAGFPSAFFFHPSGSGDVSSDRFDALSYAVVATAPDRPLGTEPARHAPEAERPAGDRA